MFSLQSSCVNQKILKKRRKKFGVSLKCIDVKKLDSFIRLPKKQKREKTEIVNKRVILWTYWKHWLTFEYSRKAKGEWTGRSLKRKVVNCVNVLHRFRVRFNLFWLHHMTNSWPFDFFTDFGYFKFFFFIF